MGTGKAVFLISSGLESCYLLCNESKKYDKVYPLYVSFGFPWEDAEKAHLKKLLKSTSVCSLTEVSCDFTNLYAGHWALGSNIPGYDAPDGSVYIPGRNVFLGNIAACLCLVKEANFIVGGWLKPNLYKDSAKRFFSKYSNLLSETLGRGIKIRCPLLGKDKNDILKKVDENILSITFSCINPIDNLHCGCCKKCAERKKAFLKAEITDMTKYNS